MVSNELLGELKLIVKQDYQLDLSDAEVEELGATLVDCFQILLESEDVSHD